MLGAHQPQPGLNLTKSEIMLLPIHAKNIEVEMCPCPGGWETLKIESVEVVASKNSKRYEVFLNLSGETGPRCAETLEYSTKPNKNDHKAIISHLKERWSFQKIEARGSNGPLTQVESVL